MVLLLSWRLLLEPSLVSSMADYHVTRTAVFVVLERDDEIFLLRRANTGWNDGKWTLPSGHVEKGERVKYAGIREAEEEAGVTIKEDDLRFLYVHYVQDEYTNFYFKAEKWEGEPILNEPDKASEVGWFNKSELPTDTIRHVREMVSDVEGNRQFSDTPNDPGN